MVTFASPILDFPRNWKLTEEHIRSVALLSIWVLTNPLFVFNAFFDAYLFTAPEVLKGHGHGIAVDWWSLGTLLFEMMTGLVCTSPYHTPFSFAYQNIFCSKNDTSHLFMRKT
jgi:hypothetical protein